MLYFWQVEGREETQASNSNVARLLGFIAV